MEFIGIEFYDGSGLQDDFIINDIVGKIFVRWYWGYRWWGILKGEQKKFPNITQSNFTQLQKSQTLFSWNTLDTS